MTNERGRRVCKVLYCTVEIERALKYCAGHEYAVKRWIEKSKETLKKAIEQAEARGIAQ